MTCWAFYGMETIKQHSLGILNFFRDNFSYIIPIISYRTGIDKETVRKSVEIGVSLHDIGKTSKQYDRSYFGHEFYSGYLVYKILRECCDSELKPLVALAAMSHHQGMGGRTLNEMILKGNYTRIPSPYELREECRDDIVEILRKIGVEIKDFPQKVTISDVKSWFQKLNIKWKNLYVIILGPLMVSDTVVANKNRGGDQYNRIIEEYEKWIKVK
ncbi:CRISPR-associated endonuclease Cas3 HD [Saccharolobus shibatae B12]|uniref:CRISPR-associated endonuclease Cas3 HD n=1 Tax=Saccharolobus shibatae (strain ATCC 51178 / DSM 5389 / JCM 8931 / NBRC 15437 / B12) TaxID=523848 RepID=A0A8F5GTX0_SACSH|nr:CRISPR-associated endonuclease Cas3'' [Saccharolobus shibatae]QXJ28802.1 CRISPR-associated endonuclease Cas3 HD [Saccharolobus shibatae B12]